MILLAPTLMWVVAVTSGLETLIVPFPTAGSSALRMQVELSSEATI